MSPKTLSVALSLIIPLSWRALASRPEMELVDHQFVSLLIRWVHVTSAALLLGGAFLLFFLARRESKTATDETARLIMGLAQIYEGIFWVALGLIVATGIGNLGAFGAALPGTQTAWGAKFIIKISVVILLVVLSMIRSFNVVTLDAYSSNTKGAFTFAQIGYGITAALLIVILFLAVSLAHG